MIYDVVVIGAGPAGSSFCRRAAAGGLSVLLVDGQDERCPKPCGGLLAPDAQKLFAHFDFTLPGFVLADPQIFSVKTIDLQTRLVRYYRRCYLNMDRFAFDRFMLSLVPEGVERVSGRCVKMRRDDGGFVITVKTRGGETREFRSRRLVGADGASSVVRRTFFDAPIMKYTAVQQWFKAKGNINPFYSCIFDPETSESCSWIICKGENIIYGGCFPKENSRERFENQKKRVEAFLGKEFGQPVLTEACLADRPRSMRDFVTGKNGVYLVGEAAGFISASSFEGISSAIKSGTLLGDILASCAEDDKAHSLYRRRTLSLRMKLFFKIWKRWFMYTPWVRRIIMRLGITAIAVEDSSTILL